ncbi:MAG: putative selenium-dependent hydroxylase accessory protein YqeC [Candidatus Eisenbacteria bacterium]|nr:putative selenium-dependent hydroxylase accessory protein YqeC [Candidatus Eisenbacteria bacterium]
MRVERSPYLSEAIGISRGDLVAFVGAGGKTGAILALVGELSSAGWTVLASTTTRVGGRMGSAMPVIQAGAEVGETERIHAEGRIAEALRAHGSALLVSGETRDRKLAGVSPRWLTELRSSRIADAVLVEADGARQRSLKLPGEHEPVIPGGSDIVVPIAGLDVLGQEIGELTAHRPLLVRAYAGSSQISGDLLVRILTDASAGLKGLPPGARCVPMLTRVQETSADAPLEIASGILARRPDRIERVVLADLRRSGYAVVRRTGR